MSDEKLWDYRFLELAETVATWSKDPSTQVGSVVVDSKRRVIGLGYNGFPRGVHDYIDRYEDKVTKYLFVSHAERNALDNSPISVENATLYATLFPCNECCKSIIQRGIRRVVTFTPNPDKQALHNHHITTMMLSESGVELVTLEKLYYEEWKNVGQKSASGSTAKSCVHGCVHKTGWHGPRNEVHSEAGCGCSVREKDRPCEGAK
jgi:dCMP deaminase